MSIRTGPTIETQRRAARRTAAIVGAIALAIFGLFWLAGILGQ